MSLDQTALNAYISSEVDDENKKYDLSNGMIRGAKYNTGLQSQMTENLKSRIRNANGRPIDISVLKKRDFEVQTSLSFAFDANLSESAKMRVAILTSFVGMYSYPIAQHAANAITSEVDFQSRYRSADIALAKAMSENIESVLNLRRTQVLDTTAAISGMTFDGTNHNIDITYDAQTSAPIFSDMATVMMDNGIGFMPNDFNYIGDAGITSIEAYRRQFNENNSMNLSQMPMQYFVDTSGSITRPAGSTSSGYLLKNGAISLIDSVPLEFAQGITIGGDVSVWDIGDMELPYSGMRPLLYRKRMEADGSVFGGSKMSYVEKYGIGLQYAIVYNYNTDLSANVNDIVRVEMLTKP